MPSINKIIFQTEDEAWEAIGYLREAIRHSGQVTFAALLDLVGIEPDYEEACYGWLNLDEADVMPLNKGYTLILPEMEKMDPNESVSWSPNEKNPARPIDKKKLLLIASITAVSTAALYFSGRKLNRSELGFNLKTKLIRKLMSSQISKNNKTFLVHYALDENYIPTEVIGKLSAAIEELLGNSNQIIKDICE